VSVIQKEESVMVMLEDSKKGHQIINKTGDITIIATTYIDPAFVKNSNLKMMEI
jgi:hypothetical protein